jgi:TolB protein
MWTGATSRRAFVFGAAALLGGAALASFGVSSAQQGAAADQRIVKIALPVFSAAADDLAETARGISRTLTDDLRTSGHFVPIDAAAMDAGDIDSMPQFGAWRSLGADMLVNGRIKTTNDGRALVEFRLWDIAAGWQLVGAQYATVPEHWPQVGHAISSAVYERLIGEQRDFDSGHP